MFSWGKSSEERMLSEIEGELADYQRRCEALHEEFRRRLSTRDEARTALSEADERVGGIQMEGVALLGRLNAAMSEGDEEKARELERDCKRNSRDLVRAQKNRDAVARRLESVEVDTKEASSELKEAVSRVLDEYARCVEERKRWLAGVAETLDRQQAKLDETAVPPMSEYESRHATGGTPDKEPPETGKPSERG